MRAEDKEVDGPDLVRAEKKQNELERGDDEEVRELTGEAVREAHGADRAMILDAMRSILEESQLSVESLHLPKRELLALEALQAAVNGRDSKLDQFMYATDRSEMLEQALAVLQPNLTYGDAKAIDGMFKDMVVRVGDLRRNLKGLEDAQDELLDGSQKHGLGKAEGGDTDDKPKPDDGDATLTGPERKVPAKASSLLGPDLAQAPKAASTLAGPAAETARPASSLDGPETERTSERWGAGPDPKIAKLASSLGGAEAPDNPAAPSTLGDPAELEALAKKPWWRRPFG